MPLSLFLIISPSVFCMCSRMSGGVNVKSAPHGPSSSGIPIPCNLMTSSPKPDPRRQARSLPRTSINTPKHTPTHSPLLHPRNTNIPGPSSREHLRDAGQKNQLFQRTGAFNIPRVSRSAYSSPLTQRREAPPHSKDTLDLGRTGSAHISSQFSHDKNCNRSIVANNNQAWRASNLRPNLYFRGCENSNNPTQKMSEVLPTRGGADPPENHLLESSIANNGNSRPIVVHPRCKHTRGPSGSTSQSDEEMGTSEDSSVASSPDPLPLPLISFPMPVMSGFKNPKDTQIPKINMATVAPFSYR